MLLDPHNEYATAFGEWAEVISPRNMQLPFWLLTFEEIVEVLIGRPQDAQGRDRDPAGADPDGQGPLQRRPRHAQRELRRAGARAEPSSRSIRPSPTASPTSSGLIDERMGKLENKKDLSPYRKLKIAHRRSSRTTRRYAFMFGSLTVYDGMTQILGRIFRVPVNDKPITIVELTGLPTEIINVVVSVLSPHDLRFRAWSEGKVPLTLVCEEAHRYVPATPQPRLRALQARDRQDRQGRAASTASSLCIVTQRPAEIDPTILSQCNTVFALRMSNDRDQEIVTSAITDTRLRAARVPARARPARGASPSATA